MTRIYTCCSTKCNRKKPWKYNEELYKRRNEVKRYFLRIKRFRRVFTRYDKLDIMYLGNLTLAMIFVAILNVNML